MQLKTNNGKCHVNCENFSAQKGCLSGWEVGKDCPGDGTFVAVATTDEIGRTFVGVDIKKPSEPDDSLPKKANPRLKRVK